LITWKFNKICMERWLSWSKAHAWKVCEPETVPREPRSDRILRMKQGARKGCAVTQRKRDWLWQTKFELMLQTGERS